MAPTADVIPVPMLKRLCDVSIAIALIVLLTPVWLAVGALVIGSMLVRPRDRGPLLYRERRISDGGEFELLKLRVLRRDVLAEVACEGGYARTYEADPANLTWAGRRLLKPWYLDELPQLHNILRGDMSLVGPRPWPMALIAEQLRQGYDYRLHVRAGWTGPAQVQKGKPEIGGPPVHDLEYVEACRTWPAIRLVRWDMALVGETIRVLLQGQGLQY